MANADQGFGTTITFSSGFLAQVRSVSWSGLAREPLETTHMTTTNGWRTFLPSDLKDAGELSVELLFDPDDLASTPITGSAETVTVTFPIPAGGSTAATWACSGFMTGFELTDPHDDLMTATATIKLTAAPTMTAGT